MNKLSPDQRTHLEKLLRKTRDVNERNRVCVILGRDDGHSAKEIADILRIGESSVYDYLREESTTSAKRQSMILILENLLN